MASSRSSAGSTASTGAKSSSVASGLSGARPATTVGCRKMPLPKAPSRAALPPARRQGLCSSSMRRDLARASSRIRGPMVQAGSVTGPSTWASTWALRRSKERLQHLLLHDHPAGGGALLPREAHGPRAGEGRGPVQVRVRQHQGGVLAPHLGLEAGVAAPPPPGRPVRPTAAEPVKLRALIRGSASSASPTVRPRPCTTLKSPAGTWALLGGARQEVGAGAGELAGLEDHGVAEGQGGRGLPEGDRQGEVPGRHQPHHPTGTRRLNCRVSGSWLGTTSPDSRTASPA